MSRHEEVIHSKPASALSLLSVTEAHLWSEEQATTHKRAEYLRRRPRRISRILDQIEPSALFGIYVATILFFATLGSIYILFPLVLLAGCVWLGIFRTPLRWERSSLLGYLRSVGEMPPQANRLVRQIRRFLPEAEFEIEYCGFDPILWVIVKEESEWKRYAVLAWDDNGTVVPVPSE